jgi:teichuronic acid biosynthesis glycosyltransferase TuaG
LEKEASGELLVSVVMPAYNAQRWIAQSIRSVQSQTMRNWELIVVDDCSSDRTRQIVEELAAEDPRIKLVCCEENGGVAKARNRGMDLSKGDYVALLDSDDLWYPEKLEHQLRLAQSTGVGVIYCSYGIIDEQDEKVCGDFIVPEATDFESSLVQSVISSSTVLFSREIANIYRFGTSFYHEDLALWLRILKDGVPARGVTVPLADYRVIKGSRSFNKLHSIACRWDVYRRYLGLSAVKSAKLIVRYGFLGLKKYSKSAKSHAG